MNILRSTGEAIRSLGACALVFALAACLFVGIPAAIVGSYVVCVQDLGWCWGIIVPTIVWFVAACLIASDKDLRAG